MLPYPAHPHAGESHRRCDDRSADGGGGPDSGGVRDGTTGLTARLNVEIPGVDRRDVVAARLREAGIEPGSTGAAPRSVVGCKGTVCREGAVRVVDGEARHAEENCVGCGNCITVCPMEAIGVAVEGVRFGEMMERVGTEEVFAAAGLRPRR
ncbi:4Fe-4S binding protein [Methanoculleus caldifontis]|uniref:4Fe-4S binding protein n=1 Tax=Methanoculleus caldifontis TaxID=2651577 RepID=UPI002936D6BD|nr:4Fe-4S binding protein [Methanoculleus sp. Wushi-C6]